MGTTGRKPTDDWSSWIPYVAGFLDGEGCFGCDQKGSVFVTVSNTYPWILRDLRDCFGGTVSPHNCPSHKDRSAWKWRVYGASAIALCYRVLPFLREKRQQALILVQLHDYPPRTASRKAMVRKLKRLKRIEYGP